MSGATAAAGSNFDALLGELETLAKGGADAGAADDSKDKADDADDKGGKGDDADADKSDLNKSLKVTLEDGTVVEAEDGTELIKALTVRLDTTEGTFVKALTSAVTLIKSQGELLKAQGQKIETLTKSIETLGGQGRGRKTVVSIHDPQSGAKEAQQEGITPTEFMTKALSACRAGKITGNELSIAEGSINRGLQVSPEIVQKVLS